MGGEYGVHGEYAVPHVVLDYNAVTAPVTRPGLLRTGTRASGRVWPTRFAPTFNAMVRSPVCFCQFIFCKMCTLKMLAYNNQTILKKENSKVVRLVFCIRLYVSSARQQ